MADENEVDVRIKLTSDIKESMEKAAEAVGEKVEAIKGSLEGMSAAVESVTAAFAGMAAIIAGGALFTEAISITREMTDETRKLARTLGESNEDAMAMAGAMAGLGMSADVLLNATTRLTMNMRRNAEAFAANKVEIKDSNGEFLNSQQVISNVSARLAEMTPGYERNALATQLLGRNWQHMIEIGRVTPEMLEEVKAKHEALNMVITQASIDANIKYGIAMHEVKEIGEAVALNVGQVMIPRLTDLAEWFSQIGPAAVQFTREALVSYLSIQDAVAQGVKNLWSIVSAAMGQIMTAIHDTFGGSSLTTMQFFINTLKVIEIAVVAMVSTANLAFEGLRGGIQVLASVVSWFSSVVEAAFKMDWEGVKAQWNRGNQALEDAVRESAARIVKIREDAATKLQAISDRAPVEKSAPDEKQSGGSGRNVEVKKGHEEKMHLWEAELAMLRLKYGEENNFRTMDKNLEAEFWKGKLDLVDSGSKEESLIQKKIYTDIFEFKKKQFGQSLALDKEQTEFRKSNAMAQVAVDEQAATQAFNLGQISHESLLQQQIQFEDRRMQIEMDAQRAMIENIAKGPDNPAALQAAKDKLIGIEQEYAAKRVKISNSADLEIYNRWKSTMEQMAGTLGTNLTSMLQGTVTWQKALTNIWHSVLSDFSSKLVKVMVQYWMLGENEKTALTESGTTTRWILEQMGLIKSQASQAAASAETIVEKKTEAVSTIPPLAAEAAGGAASSVASIPYVGPALAAAAYAETFAMVMGGLSAVSAAGGMWQVPEDQMAFIHKDESIIPAKEAEGLRSMVNAGNSGRSGGTSINISAVDSRSVERMFKGNFGSVAGALKYANRMGSKETRRGG